MREKSGRNPGGQNGHKGYYREPEKEPDEIKECLPDSQCKDGGNELDLNQAEVTEKRQEIEIPPRKPPVIEYQKMEVKCPCGTCNSGTFPEHIKASFQLGQQLKSCLIYLNVAPLIPFKGLTNMMVDLFKIKVCQRRIENSLEPAATKAMPVYAQIMSIIKNQKWVGSDETGKRVDGKKWWEWVWPAITPRIRVVGTKWQKTFWRRLLRNTVS